MNNTLQLLEELIQTRNELLQKRRAMLEPKDLGTGYILSYSEVEPGVYSPHISVKE